MIVGKEAREKKREQNRRYYWANREKELARKAKYYPAYYTKNREEILRKERSRARNKAKKEKYAKKVVRFNDGIEAYIVNMSRYYSTGHRQRCYKQLRKDFEEIQQRQHLKVA